MRPEANPSFEWYRQLRKPRWAPRPELFGTVWTVLYPLILGSFGYVFFRTFQGFYPVAVAIPFVINLIFNFAFTPLQFRLHSNLAAFLDILLVVITLIIAMAAIKPYSIVVFWVQLPYLIWISFATILQLSITVMNLRSRQPRRI